MFSRDVLAIDATEAARRIEAAIRKQTTRVLRRRGAVLGISGGIDSAVVASLCARALGKDHVLGLLMPERDASGDSLRLGRMVAEQLGIEILVEDVSSILGAAGCYARQEEAIRTTFPEYGAGCRCKVGLPSILDGAVAADAAGRWRC